MFSGLKAQEFMGSNVQRFCCVVVKGFRDQWFKGSEIRGSKVQLSVAQRFSGPWIKGSVVRGSKG